MSKKRFLFGAGSLYGIDNSSGTPTPVKFGTLKGVDIEFSGTLKELYGDKKFAEALGQGKSKITGKAKFSRLDVDLLAALYFDAAAAAGCNLPAQDEAGVIPATPFTITVANGATFSKDLGVRFALDGAPLAKVAATPATGQYSVTVATGVYLFAAADTTKAVLIDYLYTAVTGKTVPLTNQSMGQSPSFQGIFTGEHDGKKTVLILNKCVSGKLKLGSKEEDFLEQEFEFEAQSDDADQIGTLSVSD